MSLARSEARTTAIDGEDRYPRCAWSVRRCSRSGFSRSAPRSRSRTDEHDGGEGTWGLTNDKVVTNAGFIIIAGFPILVLLLTLLQNKLEKRKDRRLAAAKARRARADLRGGW